MAFNLSSETYNRLNPRCKSAMYIGYFIAFAILVIVYLVIATLFKSEVEEYLKMFDLLYLSLLAIVLIYILVAPIVFYRHYGYIITPDKIDVKKGIIVIRRTLVPLERIHQVEVKIGPINNLFGLADVELTTAGGIATIQFLEKADANNIAEELNLLINNMIKDRKKDD